VTIVVQAYKYFTNYGTRLSILTMVISAMFLVAFAAFYPRTEAALTTGDRATA
jgi:hypothetical protein